MAPDGLCLCAVVFYNLLIGGKGDEGLVDGGKPPGLCAQPGGIV